MSKLKPEPSANANMVAFPAGIVVLIGAVVLSGCINEMKTDNVLRHPVATPAAITKARMAGIPYVALGNGEYRLIADISFITRHFGKVILTKGFVSDGSSSPLDDVDGSRRAGFLHDALYRGSPHLTFVDGFPGQWSKQQADDEYCFQMKRMGVVQRLRRANCSGPKVLPSFFSPWDHHRSRRKKFWERQSG